MSQSLAHILIHLVFSTKNREPLIKVEIQEQLYAYMVGILKQHQSSSLIVNGTGDHVHLLFSLSKNKTLSDIVREVKTGSSKWIKTQPGDFQNFQWQNGYGAFSVSESNVEIVKKYIANQKKHHQKLSFKDELRQLYVKHGLRFDEEYLWVD